MTYIGNPAAVLILDDGLVGAACLQVVEAHELEVLAFGAVLCRCGEGRDGECNSEKHFRRPAQQRALHPMNLTPQLHHAL